MRSIPVRTESASYTVKVGAGLLRALPEEVAQALGAGRLPRVFVLSSPPVWELWGERFSAAFAGVAQPTVLMLPAGETEKRLGQVERLLEEMARAGADRGSVLIAFGGGIVGDVGGFLAAIYMRGMEYVQVPTTLLAQVDSSVGGKTGVNLAAGKNMVGAFHQPRGVFADTELLRTLPERELRAGLFESLKAGIIRDAGLFAQLENGAPGEAMLEEIVARSVEIKAAVVGEDEREGGVRMILNLGHTVGHAIEAVTRYSVLLHGEAIGWGMLAALHIAEGRGTVTRDEARRVQQAIAGLGPLPRFAATVDELFNACGTDKKNRGGVRRFVLPRGIGDAFVVEDVRDEELRDAIAAMLARVEADGHG